MERICVAVRVRPPVSEEEISRAFWKIDDNHISLHRPLGTPFSGVSYTFDHVFDQTCTNARVYEVLPKDIIRAAVEGFNGTVFAYGQTSSGKTFTMNGSENDPGIIHRAVKDVFDKIKKTNQREFLIRVSYMEIYNEEINDLLVLDNQKLQIHESLDRGVFAAGLREEIVSNAEQVMKILEAGEVNRHFGETNMNVRSSRSHTIFRMVIESKGKEKDISSSIDFSSSDAIRVSTLNLVDLAGSERIAKTGAGGVRLKEGKYINKSLMILGNVINKLSDGSKQRGHIPYRDSKLTRILQSALGGNAKTSIICTVAPEEVHIEETKGTLQFANRAKRITNCVQVNEILTDAALLKRQNIEIQELREKLQGSRAEVLEQEILKLRNDMLKFELEKEKLAIELEEERRLHRQRDQCIKEQQIKIENLSNLVNISGDQKPRFENHDVKTLSNTMNSNDLDMFENDAFSTPSFRAAPGSFVARRGNYTSTSDLSDSPLPDSFTNVVDEDTWAKMNKGYVADLDSINMTPAVKSQSFQSSMMSPEITDEHYKQEIEDLRRQLEIINKEKYDLQREQAEQLDLNKHLQEQMHELKKDAQQHRDVPQQLCESLTTCKGIYNDIVSIMKSSVADEKSVAAKLLSSTSEIGANLLSALESHLTTIVENRGHSNTVPMLALTEGESKEDKEITSSQPNSDHKGADTGEKTAHWKANLWAELNRIKDNHICLLRDLDLGNQASIEKYDELESELFSLKEERETLLQRVSDISGKLALVSDQRDMILRKYNSEVQRRKNVEAEIKVICDGSVSRQRSFASFHYDLKSKISSLRAQNPIGC